MMPVQTLDHYHTRIAAPEEGKSGTVHYKGTHPYSVNDNMNNSFYQFLEYKNISTINVGFITTVTAKTIESIQSIDAYLSDIKNGRYKAPVEYYRSLIADQMPIESKSEMARTQKASVPCCIPHSNCIAAPISNTLPQNGIMQIDIDQPSIGNLSVTDEQIITALNTCPYLFAYHKSIGGTGYVGYAYTEDAISESYWVIANDIQSRGIDVDLSKGSGTGEKRFVSYDPNLVIKDCFTPVNVVVGINKESIIKEYTWHQPGTKRLVEDAERAFANWVDKNGGFDWTSTGPASPAGLLANVVSQHKHHLNQEDLIQLANWCVYLYNNEGIDEKDFSCWIDYLNRYGQPSGNHCTTNSVVASAENSAESWSLVLPGFAVHHCTTALTSTLEEIDNNIRRLIGEREVESGVGKLVHSAVSANVKGAEMGVLHYDYRLESPPALLTNGDCTMLFKKSSVSREASERPSRKINEMIKTGQLQWKEQRYPTGRLIGYELPAPEPVDNVFPPTIEIASTAVEYTDEEFLQNQKLFIAEQSEAVPPNVKKVPIVKKYAPGQSFANYVTR
jgi:hypothetical protein